MSELHRISGCDNPNRSADVLFIHGLGGHPFETWGATNVNPECWLHWLGKDFPSVGIWSLGYAASPFKWGRLLGLFSERWRDAGQGMALPDRARNVLDLAIHHGLGAKPLFFICHSLGGLVAKQVLRTSSEATDPRLRTIYDKTRAVLFLATPHTGSDLASIADAFRTIFGATVTLQGLRAHDAHLGDLFEWYRNHATEPAIRTATYFESRNVRGFTIVKRAFAHPGVGADPVPLDEDHLSIAKPANPASLVFLAASNLLRETVLATKPQTALAPPTAPQTSIHVVPHELPPAAEEFFGRREELKQLIERLQSGKNTAVVGDAGLGKTALAAKALEAVVGKTSQSLAASPFPAGVVYIDLYRLQGSAESAWNTIANKLEGASFMERSVARDRTENACLGRPLLLVIEGGEEADGRIGRAGIQDILSVLSTQNRWLLLTRLKTQAAVGESVSLQEKLSREDAAELLNSLTKGTLSAAVQSRVLDLLEGHPLALTWAGNLLARGDDDAERLIDDWNADKLPGLNDPRDAEHSLEWLFSRSVRSLNETALKIVTAAALLAPAPFPFEAIQAAFPEQEERLLRESLKTLVQTSLLRKSEEKDCWRFSHVLGYKFSRNETGADPESLMRLGEWLQGYFTRLLDVQQNGWEPALVSRASEHFAALLRADKSQVLWTKCVESALYNVVDCLNQLGRLPFVKSLLEAISVWFSQFSEEKAVDPAWTRERAVLLGRSGNVRQQQGDLTGALTTFRESLEIAKRLAKSDESNAGWQRDLSVSLNKVGDVQREQGDLVGALSAYRESLEIRKGLAESNESNTEWQRDLSVSLSKVGDVQQEQGDLVGALSAYRESLEIRKGLAESDESNAVWQRDLSISLNKIGDVQREQGDLTGALTTFRESLEIVKRLAESDESNTVWQRDLSVSFDKVGDVQREQGDLAGALTAYRESLEIRKRLAESDESNAGWQRDLSVSLDKVGNVQREQGDLAGALTAYLESLEIAKWLAELDESNVGWQRDLSVSLDNVGNVQLAQGDLAGALTAYRESLEIRKRLAESDESNAGWQRNLSISLNKVGSVQQKQGDLLAALTIYRESLAIRQRLVKLDPSNATWQRDLEYVQNLLADLQTNNPNPHQSSATAGEP